MVGNGDIREHFGGGADAKAERRSFNKSLGPETGHRNLAYRISLTKPFVVASHAT